MSRDIILEIHKNGEKFLRALNEELYRNWSGLKRGSNLNSIYRSHPNLGETDLFFSVKDLVMKEEEVGARHAVPLLLGFLTHSFIGNKTAKFTDKIFTSEARQEIVVERKSIPYRAARAKIKKEQKRTKREEIDKRRKEIILKLNPLFIELLDTMHSASAELGYSSYTTLCDEVEGLKLEQLVEKAKVFLIDTEYIYRDLLGWFFQKRMELKLKDAKIHDLHYLLNSFELNANFPKTDLKSLAKTLLNEMNIEFGENVRADLEQRKDKVSEAFCLPFEPPQNIVFSIYPIGGVEDYESFFYGLGSALCYGYVEREDDFEFRSLRESASVEIFGQLFENLIFQPKWIKRYLKSDAGSDFLRFLYLRQLMKIRYYSGKLIYEMALHKDEDFESKSDFYKQMLQTATLCEHSEADYLFDSKPFFYTAIYLKASFVEPALRSYLRERFDEQWWREKESGDYLRKMWQRGGRITSQEILKRLGYKELDISQLFRFFGEVLG
ncbi:MAG: hypothetical protein HYW01_05275 [Deltaproteobacteria bacterium]|nr:hypothetical protein [Deltaproteobacteria bacterium]